MRVLIISHTVFSKTNNMGRTLLSYFRSFSPEETAQFYIHSEIPTVDTVCKNYYRFTDKDALCSIFTSRREGKVFSGKDIDTGNAEPRETNGLTKAMYEAGSKRTALIFIARNLVWRLSRWNTAKLRKWAEDFDPDVIFFASGDYSFMYNIALFLAEHLDVPLVTCCVDDFYIYNTNHKSLLGRIEHKLRMKIVRKTMARSSFILTISEGMKQAYEKLFNKRCFVINTTANEQELLLRQDASQISYMGNLSLNRNLQLIDIGKELKKRGLVLDVYTGETRKELISGMNSENGIRFHGAIPAEEVLRVMEKSMLVIHTEAFDEESLGRVRFSVSTKIAETMMYGPCLLAYGPKEAASIEYLERNHAAYVITSKENLASGLEEIIGSTDLREKIVLNARSLAKKNHGTQINAKKLRQWLSTATEEYKNT